MAGANFGFKPKAEIQGQLLGDVHGLVESAAHREIRNPDF